MTIEDAFKKSNLLNLAVLFQDELAGSRGVLIERRDWSAKVSGIINLSHDKIETDFTANCLVIVPHDWWNKRPQVFCNDYWVKKNIDFHVGEDGWVCYELDLRWTKYVSGVKQREGIRAAALYAAAWCLHHCRWLLYRHRCFYVDNVVEWPADLPAWGHGDHGRKEFLKNELRKWQRKGS